MNFGARRHRSDCRVNHTGCDPFMWDQMCWIVHVRIKATIRKLSFTWDCGIPISFLHEEVLPHLWEISYWTSEIWKHCLCNDVPDCLSALAGVPITNTIRVNLKNCSFGLCIVTVIVSWYNHLKCGESYHSMCLMTCTVVKDLTCECYQVPFWFFIWGLTTRLEQ